MAKVYSPNYWCMPQKGGISHCHALKRYHFDNFKLGVLRHPKKHVPCLNIRNPSSFRPRASGTSPGTTWSRAVWSMQYFLTNRECCQRFVVSAGITEFINCCEEFVKLQKRRLRTYPLQTYRNMIHRYFRINATHRMFYLSHKNRYHYLCI